MKLSYLALDVHLQICQQPLDFLYENKVHRQVMEFILKFVDDIISLWIKTSKAEGLMWDFGPWEREGQVKYCLGRGMTLQRQQLVTGNPGGCLEASGLPHLVQILVLHLLHVEHDYTFNKLYPGSFLLQSMTQ
jgi:hypothetical protein